MYKLSPLEIQIRDLIKLSYSNKEIASLLKITESTVHTYLARMYRKIGCSSRTELVFMTESLSDEELLTRIKFLKIQEARYTSLLLGITTELKMLNNLDTKVSLGQ